MKRLTEQGGRPMEVCLAGTGGNGGWPQRGCACASCARARAAARSRAPARVVVDGVLHVGAGQPPAGYQVRRLPGAWAVTGPDGGRLLVADGSGVSPEPPAGARPYDIVLLDLLDDPAQLGALRSRGLVGDGTVAAVLYADHRVSSEEELASRCGFWRVSVPADGDVLATTPHAGPARAAGPAAPPRRVLVLGGARSGKSRHAELRLAAEPRVTYLAAGPYPEGAQPPDDSDWAERVAAHRSRRPSWWQTVEGTDVAQALRATPGALLLDGAGTWLAAVMTMQRRSRAPGMIAAKVDELVEAWRQAPGRVVAVSDEVGSGVHPPTEAGRLFRDHLGWLNQRLAAESDEAVLVVAGRVLTLPS
jgi:adenosylcobinamide kinase / adenosylcobinamide-phosphate guanylyltransferase